MKMQGVLFILLVSVSFAQAKTLLISDIDDTLKNSHVLDTGESLANSGRTENLVLGMNLVLKSVKKADSAMPVYYVTNAPKFLMEKNHSEFLSLNKFPQGELRLRKNIFQQDFKVEEIRRILKHERPDKVLLFGDNGEKDIWIYAQIRAEFPQVQVLTFIRQAYSVLNPDEEGAKLLAGQTGFATAMDLALQLRMQNLISEIDVVSLLRSFIGVYAQEDEANDIGPQAIPAWMDCRDFHWTVSDSEFMTTPGFVDAKNRVLHRCN